MKLQSNGIGNVVIGNKEDIFGINMREASNVGNDCGISEGCRWMWGRGGRQYYWWWMWGRGGLMSEYGGGVWIATG